MSLTYILDTYGGWPFILGLVVMVLTSLTKIPVKLLITKLIKSETARSLIERFILLIPVAIGIGAWYLKNYLTGVVQGNTLCVASGAACGVLAIVYYSLFGKYIERAVLKLFKKDVKVEPSPAESAEALRLAADLAQGKPLESVVAELATGTEPETENDSAPEEKTDEADVAETAAPSLADAVALVCRVTGADVELVESILEKLKIK